MSSWLRDSLAEMLRSKKHTDCKFVIVTPSGNKEYNCHKLIFSAASEVFDRMLYGDFNEAKNGEVYLTDIEPDTFEKFREYLYGYNIKKLNTYDFDTVLKLLEHGNKYLVKSIQEDCVKNLINRKNNFAKSELLRLFQCAHTFNISILIEEISWNLQVNAKKVMDHSPIYQFNTDIFKNYINLIKGNIGEAKRFHVIELYLKYHDLDETETESDTEARKQLISLIEYSKLTAKQFYEGPGKSKLLTMEQKYEHLYEITKTGQNDQYDIHSPADSE